MDPAYWDYSTVKCNANAQAYFQYPAMMVPGMQGDIIGVIRDVFPAVDRTFDPFAGSGTILLESLRRGLESLAADVNPMALLLCRVKSQPFRVSEIEDALREVQEIADHDGGTALEIEYANRAKWFCPDALLTLSRVRRAIARVDDLEIRRVLWVAFAEAVRLSSNSRTSTYKLHIRDADDRERRANGAAERISTAMSRVVAMYRANYKRFLTERCLDGNRFRREAIVINHDMRSPLAPLRADALISSPPYGDNHTTIPYGQHSFLPLCWIPLADIDPQLDPKLLANTHSIDTASLGGHHRAVSAEQEQILEQSSTLAMLLGEPTLTAEAKRRLVTFFIDLGSALTNAVAVLRHGSPIVLTLGNRSVCGQRVPTDVIAQEILTSYGCEFIDTHLRSIPVKRMAHRNKNTGTMLTETLLAMRSPRG